MSRPFTPDEISAGAQPSCACGCGRAVKTFGRRWFPGHVNARVCPHGLRKWSCKECRSAHYTAFAAAGRRKKQPSGRYNKAVGLRRLGLTVESFEAMLIAQGHACPICGRAISVNDRQRPAMDHDHQTGLRRQILCHSCNLGLGMFGDDGERLIAAARYLRRHMRSIA